MKKYHHLMVTPRNRQLQKELELSQGRRGVSAVGMYTTDVDNHESVLKSALAPGARLSPQSHELEAWSTELGVGTEPRRSVG